MKNEKGQAECLNFCGVGSKYNSLRSHNGLVKKFAKKCRPS